MLIRVPIPATIRLFWKSTPKLSESWSIHAATTNRRAGSCRQDGTVAGELPEEAHRPRYDGECEQRHHRPRQVCLLGSHAPLAQCFARLSIEFQ